MKIANFTPEEIPWTHEGITGIIKPNEVVNLPDNRAKFILSKWDVRGLVQMEFGDDEPTKRKESMAKYTEFWIIQIATHNQLNESRKFEGKGYIRPTKQLAKHAEELNIELIGPWTAKVVQKPNQGEIEGLKSEISDLRGMVRALLEGKVNQGTAADVDIMDTKIPGDIKLPDTQIKIQPEIDWVAVRNSFRFLGKMKLDPYLQENKELIAGWPPALQAEFIDKYQKVYERIPDLT